MEKLWTLLTSGQSDYSTTVFLICFPIFFVLAIVWWIRKIRTVEEMEGIWYCREVKLQISFTDPNNSFLMENGERIQCKCDAYATKHNIGNLEVLCYEWDHPHYKHGKTLFIMEMRKYTETTMLVYDRKSHREYTFVRTDKIG